MRPKSYTSRGIVLACRDLGEADRVVVVFSEDLGRLTLIAKGVRRLKSKKRGHIEVFNFISFHAISSKSLDIMTEVEVVAQFNQIKTSLKRISLGYYLVEVVSKITNEGEFNKDLFDLIYNFLKNLTKTNKLKKLRLDFVLDLLVLMGYWDGREKLANPDEKLSEIIERQITSVRVGKKMLI